MAFYNEYDMIQLQRTDDGALLMPRTTARMVYFANGTCLADLDLDKATVDLIDEGDGKYKLTVGNMVAYIPSYAILSTKQDTLVSGQNIKTINGESILGEGNIVIHGGEGGSTVEVNPILTSGTEIATISVDGESKTLYAPNGGTEFDYGSAIKTTEVSGFTTSSQTVQGAINEVNDALDDKADASALANKQDALVSGTNIKTINGESILGAGDIEIQGGGATYTAGDNIQISDDNVISATDTKYTAGSNITISEDNVISASSSGGDFDYDNAVNNTVVETLQTTNKTVVGAINEIMEYDIPFAENLRF